MKHSKAVQQSPLAKHESTLKCEGQNCQQKIQASCFSCRKIYCFKCSLLHVQNYKNHRILELDQSINQIAQLSKQNLKILSNLKQLIIDKNSHQKNQQKLNPQKFQQQLDQITFIKKQTLNIVQKFFSEISLELINIWETYLKKYSGNQANYQIYQDLVLELGKFSQPWTIKSTAPQIIKNFHDFNFEKDVRQLKSKLTEKVFDQIPKCPQLYIEQRVLVEISQLLCSTISTYNYHSIPQSNNKINITKENYLNNSIKYIPIFPIKRQYCYLYDMQEKVYQIQEFNKLECLPAYPKSVLLPNGDLHIIGGLDINNKALNSHIVYRSSTAEVFKLSNIPQPRNPSNSLIYYKDRIFIIGGTIEGNQWDNRCFVYNLPKKQWRPISNMHYPKPHQSSCLFTNQIYCFGIPQAKRLNIQKYDIESDRWQQISISNLLSNPFNFAAGFSCIQINSAQILLFGGKKFIESTQSNKRSTDRKMCQNMYCFRPQNNSFAQLGAINLCMGVQYGQINPIIHNGNIYSIQFLISKNNPIVRWYETLQVTQINSKGNIENVMILHQD